MDKLSELLEIAKQAAQTSGNFLKNEFYQDQEASLNKGRDQETSLVFRTYMLRMLSIRNLVNMIMVMKSKNLS